MINSHQDNAHLNELGNGRVHIKDPDNVENTINRFVQDGLDKLQASFGFSYFWISEILVYDLVIFINQEAYWAYSK